MKLKTQGILRSLTIPRHGEVLVGGGDKGCTVWSIVACANKKRCEDNLFIELSCTGISTISSRGLCLNYLKKISQTWWSNVGSILQ